MHPTLTTMAIADIMLNPRNARTHPEKQLRQLENSIRIFGFTNPILLDETNTMVAGEGRWKAATRMGLTAIPVIHVAGLTKAQRKGLALADNRIALENFPYRSWKLIRNR